VGIRVSREQVVWYRLRASHLDAKLPPGAFADAAWGGLQDSVPRGGVIALHARVEGTQPDSWEDPSLVQIWFRGGADYIVPRADVGVFTLGARPRDAEQAARLDRLADEIHDAARGETLTVRELASRLPHGDRILVKTTGPTGRIHIRWDASNIWLIPVERPDLDPEDARLELGRRFIRSFGPTTKALLTRWTGVSTDDAAATWKALEPALVEVTLVGDEARSGETRFALATAVDALTRAEPVEGVRLIPFDDTFAKLDKELLVADRANREMVFPPVGMSRGYIPGPVLVDGEIVGVWGRQQRKVTIHAWRRLGASVRAAIEEEALSFPIAGTSALSVRWPESAAVARAR
jgi:hypothetical protein